MEILAPAGSFPSLVAAVYAGADAVYFGAREFNARERASNFSETEIFEAVDFCHERGVNCFAVVNTLIRDREFSEAEALVRMFCRAKIDAFIVQDTALASFLIKNTDVPVHASTQMTIHSLDGAEELYEAGFRRIVLSRELSKEDISYIVRNLPDGAETEIFCHGALCVCYGGQCYMSSVIGKRSGNRGLCAQPCRLPYQDGYRLSLKDLSLLERVRELKEIGVSSLKIEGRMKSPEYVYAVTKAYSDAVRGVAFSPETEERLAEIFSRSGFTKGYFENKLGKEMFGIKSSPPSNVSFSPRETKRFGVDIFAKFKEEGVVEIRFVTSDKYTASAEVFCERAKGRPTDRATLEKQLFRLGDTVYYPISLSAEIPEDIFIPVSELNRARRECVESLSSQRKFRPRTVKNAAFSPVKTPFYKAKKRILRGVFLNPSSVPENAGKLEKIWIPLSFANKKEGKETIDRFGDKVGFVLPRIFHDSEKREVLSLTEAATDAGAKEFLCGNIGQIRFLRDFSLSREIPLVLHGDFGLNIYNSVSSMLFFKKGLESEILSFELPAAALRDFSSERTGILAYGRLPFMIMRNCVKKNCGKPEFLLDRKGKNMLLTCDFSCRNSVWNADILWLADKNLSDFGFLQLLFTDEKKNDISLVIDEYLSESQSPAVFSGVTTRGLYF